MYIIIKVFLFFLLALHSKCQRRIVDGEEVDSSEGFNKPYMVYIVWDMSHKLFNQYYENNPLCGGSLIKSNLVLTSAACLRHFPKQYVVAGYHRYVPGAIGRDEMENECLKLAKKLIVEKCYCDPLDMTYDKKLWYINDVGLARTKTPYDLNDVKFENTCSYKPKTIKIYRDDVADGTNVMMLGWGSAKYRLPPNTSYDVNQIYLRGTTTKTINIKLCNITSQPFDFILKNRYCTDGVSKVNIYGQSRHSRRIRSQFDNGTKDEPMNLKSIQKMNPNESIPLLNNQNATRRIATVCQNDHGGPLVTWINGEEVVIGVILHSLLNSHMECINPSVHASLYYFGNFVDCGLRYFSGLKINKDEDCVKRKRWNETTYCDKLTFNW